MSINSTGEEIQISEFLGIQRLSRDGNKLPLPCESPKDAHAVCEISETDDI